MTINKTWFHTGFSSFLPAALVTRLKNAVKIEVPTGYQDETGFHAGTKTAEPEIKWPTTW